MPEQKGGHVQADLPIKIAVSSCLLGNLVRYDGGHTLHRWIAEDLAQQFELVAVCPEVGIGLGAPRKMLQLRDDPADPYVKGIENPTVDVTKELKGYAEKKSHDLPDICGYIFKSRSPSCGLTEVPVYNASGDIIGYASGVYAQTIRTVRPDLPVVDETKLYEQDQQKLFVDRVRQYHQKLEKNNVL